MQLYFKSMATLALFLVFSAVAVTAQQEAQLSTKVPLEDCGSPLAYLTRLEITPPCSKDSCFVEAGKQITLAADLVPKINTKQLFVVGYNKDLYWGIETYLWVRLRPSSQVTHELSIAFVFLVFVRCREKICAPPDSTSPAHSRRASPSALSSVKPCRTTSQQQNSGSRWSSLGTMTRKCYASRRWSNLNQPANKIIIIITTSVDFKQ